MPVTSTSLYGGQGKPSCYDRVSTSFMMGATIGITIGILFGGIGGLRYFIYILTLKFCRAFKIRLLFGIGLGSEAES